MRRFMTSTQLHYADWRDPLLEPEVRQAHERTNVSNRVGMPIYAQTEGHCDDVARLAKPSIGYSTTRREISF